MYNTSTEYKNAIYTGQQCLLNIYIDGNLVDDDDIWGFKVSHNLFSSDTVSLGSTTSRAIELQINKEALPETYSSFYVETGLSINGTDEIVPIGYFTLEDIQKDDNVVTITAVDYMMKFEKIISSAVRGTALALLEAICNACNVELAATEFIGDDTELELTDTTLTARQIVGFIAELAGGFAFIGRDGKLYIRTIGENSAEIDIELFQDYAWGEKFVCNEVDFISADYDFEVSDTDYSSAWLDCVLDSALYANDLEGQPINISNANLFVTKEEQVEAVYNNVKELELNGFTGSSMIDPAIDIGDIIYIEDKPVVFQGDMEYLGYFKGNISSTIQTEEKNKTTVPSVNLLGMINKKVDSDKVIEAINNSEEGEQITSGNINLDGYSSSNGNFSIDDDGNPSVSDENGNEMTGRNGVYSNLHFQSSSDFEELGFWCNENNEENGYQDIKLGFNLPNNFKVTKAYITILHKPLALGYQDDIVDYGYARSIKLYKTSALNGAKVLYYDSEWWNEEYEDIEEVNSGLGSNGYTPSAPSESSQKIEKKVSSDISTIISGGYNELILRTSNAVPTYIDGGTELGYPNWLNAKKQTGAVIAILDIYGYMNATE